MESTDVPYVRQRYHEAFGAALTPSFSHWMDKGETGTASAALGYRRAGDEPLFLERYLDEPIEALVSAALSRNVPRGRIVEIGNFAAGNALAMLDLWGAAANDLGSASEVAVATLTAPLRSMFARVGVPIATLAPACANRVGEDLGAWGKYYELDPRVCAGVISQGQQAISAFLARRRKRNAA